MAYLFSKASLIGTGIISFVGIYLGGYDKLLTILITLMIIDYISGVLGAIYNKQLNSQVGFKGIIKKIYMLLAIAVAYQINLLFPDTYILILVKSFFIANEGISFCENAGKFIPLPEQLKQIFVQLRKKEGGTNEG